MKLHKRGKEERGNGHAAAVTTEDEKEEVLKATNAELSARDCCL